MSKFKFTIDSTTKVDNKRNNFKDQTAPLDTAKGDSPRGSLPYSKTIAGDKGPRTYKFFPAGSGYDAYATITSKDDNLLSQGTYVFDTDTDTLTSGAQGSAPSPGPGTSATSAEISTSVISDALKELVREIIETFPYAPSSAKPDLDATSEVLDSWFEPGFEDDAVVNSDRQDGDPPEPVTSQKVISAVNGKYSQVTPVHDLVDTKAIEQPDFANFLIQGDNDSLTSLNPQNGEQLKNLHINFQEMLDYLKVDKDKMKSTIDSLKQDSGNSTTQEQNQASDTEPEETGEAAQKVDVDEARTQIVDILKLLAEKKPSNRAKRSAYESSDFAPGEVLNDEIRSQITRIENNESIDLNNPKKLVNNDLTKVTEGHPVNAGVFEYLVSVAPDIIADELDKPENLDAKTLLTSGANGKLESGSDAKDLYDNCVKFADYMNIKEDFIVVLKNDDSSESEESEESEDDDKKDTEDTKKGEDTEEKDDESTKKKKKSDGVEDAPQPAKGPAFYISIYGASAAGDVDDPKIKITSAALDVGTEGKRVLDYDFPKSDLGQRRSIPINDSTRSFFQAVDDANEEVVVTVTAVPATGGEPISISKRARVIYPPTKDTSLVPVLKFFMSEEAGYVSIPGVEADVGKGGAKDKKNDDGKVGEVYWTQSGGVKQTPESSAPGSRTSAVGKTYLFQFDDRPLIVPVMLTTQKTVTESAPRRIVEAAGASIVPHWIFIKPSSTGAGAGTGGAGAGAGGGRGAGGGQKEAVNIAVSKIRIETQRKWITVPSTGNIWDKDTFVYVVTPGSGSDVEGVPADVKTVMCKDDLRGVSDDELKSALYNALFNSSEAFRRLGRPCWASSGSVTGPNGVTARERTQKVGMVG